MLKVVFYFCLFLASAGAAFTNKPVVIGGLFELYDHYTGEIDPEEIQLMAVFLFAIKALNNHTDGLFDDLLPHTEIQTVIRNADESLDDSVVATNALINAVIPGRTSDVAIDGVVICQHDINTLVSSQLFSELHVVHVVALSHDSHLGLGSIYKFRTGTLPILSFQGVVWQDIMCHFFNYTKMGVFASDDMFGVKSRQEFTEMQPGSDCEFDIVYTHVFREGITSFKDYIHEAQETHSNVYVLFFHPESAAHLLEQGFNLGLFHEGVQIVVNEAVTTYETYSHFSEHADVPHIMEGIISLLEWSEYSLREPIGQLFLQRWNEEMPLLEPHLPNCYIDEDVSTEPFQFWFNVTDHEHCGFLNVTALQGSGVENIDHYVGAVFDAVVVLAMGLHTMFENNTNHNDTVSGDQLLGQIIDHVEFNGTSGLIDIFEGVHYGHNNYGHGSRERGNHYKLMNFQEHYYRLHESYQEGWVHVGTWTHEEGVHLCNIDGFTLPDCHEIEYNNHNDPHAIMSDLPPFTLQHLPEIVKILIMIPEPIGYEAGDEINWLASERLSAIVMAINEINDHTDGIYDDLLVGSQMKYAVGVAHDFLGAFVVTADLLESAFGGSGIDLVICATESDAALGVLAAATDNHVPTVVSVAREDVLGDGHDYPYKVGTVPIYTYQGAVFQDIMCHFFDYKRVAIFSTDDYSGIKTRGEFIDGHWCSLDIISDVSFSSKTVDFSEQIAATKKTGALIFLMFVDDHSAGFLLEQAYDAGLFGPGTQILIGDHGITNYTHFTADADVQNIMKGVIMVHYWPEYNLRLPAGQRFMERWTNQTHTIGYTYNATSDSYHAECNNTLDDQTGFYMYRQWPISPYYDPNVACTGLEFSTYNVNGSGVDVYLSHSYDAVITGAFGLNYTMYGEQEEHHSVSQAAQLTSSIIDHTNFDGASGHIEIYEGNDNFGHYGLGNREVGSVYHVEQFDYHDYELAHSLEHAMLHVGTWHEKHGIDTCTVTGDCVAEFHYNTINPDKNTIPVEESHPPVYDHMESGLEGYIIFLAVVVFLVAASALAFVYVFVEDKSIKASQPIMLYSMISGCFFSFAKILIVALPITDATCISGLWCGHSAFVLVVGTLFFKTYRIHKLVNGKSFSRKKITAMDTFLNVVALYAFLVVYMIVLTAVGVPHKSYHVTDHSNQLEYEPFCSYDFPEFHTALFCMEALGLILSFRLCWATRNVPDKINESFLIAICQGVIVLFSVLVFPMAFLLPTAHITKQVIVATSFAMCTIAVLNVLIGKKAQVLLTPAAVADVHDHDSHRKKLDAADDDMLIYATRKALTSRSTDANYEICREQLGMWQSVLTKISLDHNSSGSKGASVSRINSSIAPPASLGDVPEGKKYESVKVGDTAKLVLVEKESEGKDGNSKVSDEVGGVFVSQPPPKSEDGNDTGGAVLTVQYKVESLE